ncbi:hypothetical protein M231_02459 [Tremella mesenterica]|uniref:Nucleolar protein 16 n=1 Tax=Tremella mesenterica TaxID=5217 RepID=A0A4Q1BQH3_TREME|nr:hypothetical protein M231_02459 [Tremella mesenterica]
MANPRQRNKARSSKTHKPSLNQKRRMRQAKRKPPALKGPLVLQEGWDKTKTVFQNYAALGLLPTIPLPSNVSRSHKAQVSLPAPEGVKVGFGRIVRDEEGNVVDIIIDEDENEDQSEKMDEDEIIKEGEAETKLMKELQRIASTSKPVKRHTSTSEHAWLSSLVSKHGEDYTSMSKDKENVWQKTPGELKRMVKKAGGVEGLRGV